jgi:hypothetical protein
MTFVTSSICTSNFPFRSGSSLISATQAFQIAFLFSHSLRLYEKFKNQNQTKRGDFRFHCTEGSDNFQCVYTCTYQGRAGRKNPSTSAHSLKTEWQICSLTLATHAESQSEKGRGMNYKFKTAYLEKFAISVVCIHKTWRHYVEKDVDDSGDE